MNINNFNNFYDFTTEILEKHYLNQETDWVILYWILMLVTSMFLVFPEENHRIFEVHIPGPYYGYGTAGLFLDENLLSYFDILQFIFYREVSIWVWLVGFGGHNRDAI